MASFRPLLRRSPLATCHPSPLPFFLNSRMDPGHGAATSEELREITVPVNAGEDDLVLLGLLRRGDGSVRTHEIRASLRSCRIV
jgi:hypothetical protein